MAAGLARAQEPRAVGTVRQYALNYSQSLPDYTCVQETRRIVTTASRPVGKQSKNGTLTIPESSKADAIEEEISFVGGAEHYKVLKVNGIAAKNITHEQLSGTLPRANSGGC